MPSHPTRRQFVQAMAAAAPLLYVPSLRAAPNDRITLGFIGVGTMGGHNHVNKFLGNPGVQIVAICDVVRERRDHWKNAVETRYGKDKKGDFKGCQTYENFTELLDRKDVDAVVIATPDHWHAIPCVLAAQAKKDIYCEKPLTHTIREGRKIVDAVAANKVIFQTGSQQRSEFGGHFRKAVELVRNGRIGKVHAIHIGVGGSPVACDLPEQPVPDGTNWDLWLGPAPKRGYSDVLCPKGVHNHFPAWRNYKEYAGGGLADMGAHHFDIAQWALDMDNSGPVKIEPPAGKQPWGLKFTYANGVVMFHGYPPDDKKFEGKHRDCIFEGTEGTIFVSRGGIATEPDSILKTPIAEKGYHVYASSDHHRNWIECVKSRKDAICTAETGQRSAAICHLANIGYELRRPLTWDPMKEQFAGDADANKLIDCERRGPWKL